MLASNDEYSLEWAHRSRQEIARNEARQIARQSRLRFPQNSNHVPKRSNNPRTAAGVCLNSLTTVRTAHLGASTALIGNAQILNYTVAQVAKASAGTARPKRNLSFNQAG